MGGIEDDEREDAELRTELAGYERKAVPANTRRASSADWRSFRKWCERRSRRSLPATPETLAKFIAARARTVKVSTLRRQLATIRKVHVANGHADPTRDSYVKKIWRGMVIDKGDARARKSPLLVKHIHAMLDALPEGLAGARDRALLLLGFSGAFRRGELVSLEVSDCQLADEGLVVSIRRGKTDQAGRGRKVGIPYLKSTNTCPVRAVVHWLRMSGIERGAIFRKVNRHGALEGERLSDRSVAIIVKRSLRSAGLRSSNFSGHSLRAGLATAAAASGASYHSIMGQTGHRSLKSLLQYIRDGSLFRDNPVTKIGL